MEEYGKKQGRRVGRYSSDDASLDLIEDIKQLVRSRLQEKERLNYDELLDYLRRWWCHYYRRPYKDPLLESYTLEELLFEYYDIELPAEEQTKSKKVEKMMDEDRDWAAEEEARELAKEEAAAKKAEAAAPPAPPSDIIPEVKDDDVAWADKYAPAAALVNPTADEALKGGDISATFGG